MFYRNVEQECAQAFVEGSGIAPDTFTFNPHGARSFTVTIAGRTWEHAIPTGANPMDEAEQFGARIRAEIKR